MGSCSQGGATRGVLLVRGWARVAFAWLAAVVKEVYEGVTRTPAVCSACHSFARTLGAYSCVSCELRR